MAKQAFHNYVMNFSLAAAVGATANDSIQIDRGVEFVWTKSTFFAHTGGTPTKEPTVTANLQEGGSKQALSSEAVPVSALFGSGEIPFILPTHHIIRDGSTFYVTLTNLAAVAYDIYLVFSGYHRWR